LTERQRTVALLIDYDNLQMCYSRDAPGTQLDLGAVVAMAQSYGRVVVARAYAEWNLLSERMTVYNAGIEPAFAPVLRPEGSSRDGKSLADTVMVADGVDVLWSYDPDVLVLVTSDKDMIPLARLAKQRGTLVVVLGSDLTAVQLLELANEFVTYRHLVRELGRSEQKPAPARVRATPPLRRRPEAAGTRAVSAAREATLREPRALPSRSRPRLNAATAAAPAVPAVDDSTTEAGLEAAGDGAVSYGAEGVSLPADEAAPSIAPRRRRRRGGRGRRTTLAGSSIAEADASAASDAVEGQPPADEEFAMGQAADEAVPDSGVAVETVPGDLDPVASATGRTLASEPGPVIPPVEEPPPLRPWERWPESGSRPTSLPVSERAEAAAPSTAEEDALAAEAAVRRASLGEEAVNKEVADEWKPTADGETTSRSPRRRRAPRSTPARPRSTPARSRSKAKESPAEGG
jgi:uncharacterized LabA/DUF88 family protein